MVAAAAHGVAQALGLKSTVYGGQVFNEDNEPQYDTGHYWTVINGAVVVESPQSDHIIFLPIGGQGNKRRLVPLKTAKRGHASMKKARGLKPMSEAVRHGVERSL